MKQPLESMKSRETMGTAIVKIFGITAALGVASAAAGAVGARLAGIESSVLSNSLIGATKRFLLVSEL